MAAVFLLRQSLSRLPPAAARQLLRRHYHTERGVYGYRPKHTEHELPGAAPDQGQWGVNSAWGAFFTWGGRGGCCFRVSDWNTCLYSCFLRHLTSTLQSHSSVNVSFIPSDGVVVVLLLLLLTLTASRSVLRSWCCSAGGGLQSTWTQGCSNQPLTACFWECPRDQQAEGQHDRTTQHLRYTTAGDGHSLQVMFPYTCRCPKGQGALGTQGPVVYECSMIEMLHKDALCDWQICTGKPFEWSSILESCDINTDHVILLKRKLNSFKETQNEHKETQKDTRRKTTRKTINDHKMTQNHHKITRRRHKLTTNTH